MVGLQERGGCAGEDGSCANGGCFLVMVLHKLVHERLRCCHGFPTWTTKGSRS